MDGTVHHTWLLDGSGGGVISRIPRETWDTLNGGPNDAPTFDLILELAEAADDHVRALVSAFPETPEGGYILTAKWVRRDRLS